MFNLTQEVYNDTPERLSMKETIAKHVCEQIKFLRDEFKALPFDFHSCFYYEEGRFKLHRTFQK